MKEEASELANGKKKPAAESLKSKLLNAKVKVLLQIFLCAVVGPVILYTLFFLFLRYQSSQYHHHHHHHHHHQLHHRSDASKELGRLREDRPSYRVYGRDGLKNEGHLKHVFAVLDRLGFQRWASPSDGGDTRDTDDGSGNNNDWDLLWAHDYPFRNLGPSLRTGLKPHQLVNHFPGCGYITNKLDLSRTESRFIPPAFKLPEDRRRFLEYAREQPSQLLVEKSNGHRGVRIRGRAEELLEDQLQEPVDGEAAKHNNNSSSNSSTTASSSSSTFMQVFVERPYLVDGHKFDIGIYTVITSVDPLRIYVYKGDVLFRFCPEKYYPFDPANLDKYVIGDDYLPIWQVGPLRDYYSRLGFSMKDSFDSYARSRGQEPQQIWDNCYQAIRELVLSKESQIREIAKRYGTGRNFFELVRFDFVFDEELNVFMMEANMSPNLSSAHYPPNQLLYEQVLYNLFALVGLAQRVRKDSLKPGSKAEQNMIVADKNLVVLPDVCSKCEDCFKVECQLCKPCFTEETRLILTQSYWEHHNKMDHLRIFPPPIKQNMSLKDYSLKNQLLVRWYQGKCELDPSWCN